MQGFRQETVTESQMSPEEARDVITLFQQRMPEGSSGPSVADLAEVLQVPPEEVQALLGKVRTSTSKTSGDKRLKKAKQRERYIWLASGLVAILIMFGTLHRAPWLVPAPLLHHQPPVSVPPSNASKTTLEDITVSLGPTDDTVNRIVDLIGNEVNQYRTETGQPTTERDTDRDIQVLSTSDYHGPMMWSRPVRVLDEHGLVLASREMPFYTGNSAKVEHMMRHLRNQRIKDLASEAKKVMEIQ